MRDHKYTVSEATTEDFKEVESFLIGQASVIKNSRVFQWKYLDNPGGRARVFVIRDEEMHIKGVLSYLPRIRESQNSERFLIMQAVDAFVSPDARGYFLYDQLIRYSSAKLATPIYTFPNKTAERIELRNGWEIIAPLNSWYFPIRIGLLLCHTRFRVLAPLLNLISRLYAFGRLNQQSHFELRRVIEFDDDFCIRASGPFIERTGKFLNWRFINNPISEFVCHEIYISGELVGYFVYTVKGAAAVIYDFVALKDRRACIIKILEYLQAQNVSHLVFRCVGMDLGKYGFIRRRSNANIIVHNLKNASPVFTLGDSDWD